MKTLVTGANGFFGSHLVDRLLMEGHEVHVLIRKTSNLQWLLGKNIRYHYGDVAGNLKGLQEAVRGMDVVFHVAGVIRSYKKSDYSAVNAQGTVNVLEACLKENPKVQRVVLVTSLAAHGPNRTGRPAMEDDECHPLTEYGKSKREAEILALKYRDRLPITIIRPPAIYGPRDDQVLHFFKMIKKGFVLLPGLKRQFLNLAHVQDVVTGLMLAAQSPKAVGQVYFVGEDKNYEWSEIAQIVGGVLHKKPLMIRIPATVVYTVAAVTEFLGRVIDRQLPINIDYSRNFLQTDWRMDITRIQRELGFQSAYSFERGAEETLRWYESEGWL